MTAAAGISHDHETGEAAQNLALAFGNSTIGIPIAAGLLYPFFGL